VAQTCERAPAHFVAEIEAGADINVALEQYASLPVELVHAYRGDEFAAPFVIWGASHELP
jgi:hypothetical protein